jgi:hypothetical protein
MVRTYMSTLSDDPSIARLHSLPSAEPLACSCVSGHEMKERSGEAACASLTRECEVSGVR